MMQISWAEGIGYLASFLVFCTFYMKTMLPLRGVAIASNVAFMAYGLADGVYPVFVLHAVLLPLNCLRLGQMRRLIRQVRVASRGDMPAEWLIPLMTRRHLARGDVLFRRGDPGSSMYLILAGSVRITELGIVLGPGALVGEMGVFGPDHRRTGTAVCETEVEIGSISDEQAKQLYYQNPAFGFHLFQLVVRRVLENERRWRAQDTAGRV
jgi:CRP/FNR family transcriptional regulator, cyclic AMP receptor protein